MYSKENNWGGLQKKNFYKRPREQGRHVIEEMKIEEDGHERGCEKTEKEKYRRKE